MEILENQQDEARASLVKWAKSASRDVGDSFDNPDADWVFTVLGRDAEDKTVVIGLDPAFFSSQEKKNILAYEVLPNLIREYNLVALAMIVSTWMVKAKDDDEVEHIYDEYGSLADHPDRMEALLVIGADRFGDESHIAYIHRTEDGPPELGEWKPWESEEMGGRFLDPLRTALRPQG